MPGATTLLVFCGASLALLAIPGPAVIYLVTRTLDQGREAGIVSVLGIEAGTFAYAVAAAVGLTGLIAASQTGFAVVKYLGAAYLVYLGVRKLLTRAGDAEVDADAGGPGSTGGGARARMFVRGALVQLLNPKIAIFFLAFLPQFVDRSGGGSVAPQILLLGTIFTLLALVSDGAYVLLAGVIGARLRGRRWARLDRMSGLVYIGLGVAAALGGRPASARAPVVAR